MRRALAVLFAGSLLASACTVDVADPVPVDRTESGAPSATDDPGPTQPDEPRDPPAFVGTTTTEAPKTDAPSEDPDPSASETDDPDAPDGGGTGGDGGPAQALGTWNRSSTSVNGGVAFQASEPVTRASTNGARDTCQVAAAAGETFHLCRSVFIFSKSMHLSVVDMTDSNGARAVRIFRQEGGSHVSTLMANSSATSMSQSAWPNDDGLILVTLNTLERVVVEWTGSSPTLAADFGPAVGGESIAFVAGRIVRRIDELGGGGVTVLVPGAGASSGTRIDFSSDDPAPTDVALRVYRMWIAGDFASMEGLATPDVIAALQRDRNSTDLFTFSGTACSIQGNQALCSFNSIAGTTTWTLERRGGTVKVAALG